VAGQQPTKLNVVPQQDCRSAYCSQSHLQVRTGCQSAFKFPRRITSWLDAGATERQGVKLNRKKLYRLYKEERLTVRKRGGRKRALGTRAPMAILTFSMEAISATDRELALHASGYKPQLAPRSRL
jgi:hypothetical protein